MELVKSIRVNFARLQQESFADDVAAMQPAPFSVRVVVARLADAQSCITL